MEAALASGSWKNKTVQARKYIQYLSQCKADPLKSMQYHIMSYIIMPQDALRTPRVVMNNYSSDRMVVKAFSGHTEAFDTYPILLVLSGIC